MPDSSTPIITNLKSHPARPGRIRVEIDDQYAFELSRKVILAKGVSEGERLTPERLKELEAIAAREAAVGLLARRERSRAELATALRRKRLDPELIENVLHDLEKEKLLSDERFAGAWVNTRRRLSPRGRAALSYELKQKGIRKKNIDQAISNYSRADELGALRELIEGRLARYAASGDDRAKVKHRLLGFLARRGFAYEDVEHVLREHFPGWA
ncbi:MAG: regulatory protein RecX [candidate division Zixibacteria bacterium]|nr:regulatory protein RecX [candidate division Zixibacteria bacterium]